jgi:hypothetical protein
MNLYRRPKNKKDYLVTIAIGNQYFDDWISFAKPGWDLYCEKFDLGLIVITDDLIDISHTKWKKPTWQKLLIGDFLLKKNIEADRILYLDTDILISPFAKNIFDLHNDNESLGLVSKRNNMPFSLNLALKKIAYNRHNHFSSSYPLDSSLFISLQDLYTYHNLTPVDDEACMGFILFTSKHFAFMKECFHKYDKYTESITNGGDQAHLNYEFQSNLNIIWYPYEFQALWVFEMAIKYPFLYFKENIENKSLINNCIKSCLEANNFLHFAGSWKESSMWKLFNPSYYTSSDVLSFENYLNSPSTGHPVGFIKESK